VAAGGGEASKLRRSAKGLREKVGVKNRKVFERKKKKFVIVGNGQQKLWHPTMGKKSPREKLAGEETSRKP